jgi:hypothetical protein
MDHSEADDGVSVEAAKVAATTLTKLGLDVMSEVEGGSGTFVEGWR